MAVVKPGGLLLYESGNIFKPLERTDIDIGIPATTEALLMKNAKIMNMIMLGALFKTEAGCKTRINFACIGKSAAGKIPLPA